jgi:hypothetical protein
MCNLPMRSTRMDSNTCSKLSSKASSMGYRAIAKWQQNHQVGRMALPLDTSLLRILLSLQQMLGACAMVPVHGRHRRSFAHSAAG